MDPLICHLPPRCRMEGSKDVRCFSLGWFLWPCLKRELWGGKPVNWLPGSLCYYNNNTKTQAVLSFLSHFYTQEPFADCSVLMALHQSVSRLQNWCFITTFEGEETVWSVKIISTKFSLLPQFLFVLWYKVMGVRVSVIELSVVYYHHVT